MSHGVDCPAIPTSMQICECRLLEELARDGVVCELGGWYGHSAVVMGRVAREVHSIDWHRGETEQDEGIYGDTLPHFMANIEQYSLRDKIIPHVGHIEQVGPILGKEIFDLVFIDATHTVEAVERDWRLLEPTLKKGGWVAFHDYTGGYTPLHEPIGPSVVVDRIWGKPQRLAGLLAVVQVGS